MVKLYVVIGSMGMDAVEILALTEAHESTAWQGVAVWPSSTPAIGCMTLYNTIL